jgi:hypothetical protein
MERKMKPRPLTYIAIACAVILVAPISAESKTYQDSKACKKDYKRLCPNKPIGQCDLATMMDDLSPACKTLVGKSK